MATSLWAHSEKVTMGEMEVLPHEMRERIMDYLPIKDLMNCSHLNSEFKKSISPKMKLEALLHKQWELEENYAEVEKCHSLASFLMPDARFWGIVDVSKEQRDLLNKYMTNYKIDFASVSLSDCYTAQNDCLTEMIHIRRKLTTVYVLTERLKRDIEMLNQFNLWVEKLQSQQTK
jgi:hypothetical protein